MYSVYTPAAAKNFLGSVAMNSEPSSLLRCLGAPHTLNTPAIR